MGRTNETPANKLRESNTVLAQGEPDIPRIGPADSGITRKRGAAQLVAYVRWFALVNFHRLRANARSLRWWIGNAAFVSTWAMIGWPILVQNSAHRWFYIAGLIVVKVALAVRLTGSATMKLVRRGYLERKLLAHRLILEARHGHGFSAAQIARYQKEVLSLIAMFVRSHREDISGTEIFVNLLIDAGTDLVVIARDSDHRRPGARYSKVGMMVADVFARGEACYTGNIEKEWGTKKRGYKSVLAIPVRSELKILAVVSIDSTREHHFDIERVELERYLAPYVALLVWTLERSAAISALPAAASAAGE